MGNHKNCEGGMQRVMLSFFSWENGADKCDTTKNLEKEDLKFQNVV